MISKIKAKRYVAMNGSVLILNRMLWRVVVVRFRPCQGLSGVVSESTHHRDKSGESAQ